MSPGSRRRRLLRWAEPQRAVVLVMAIALLAASGFAIASSPPVNKLVLSVSPRAGRVGQAVAISVGNAAPGSRVEVGAALVDPHGRHWQSEGVFRADADGNVNVAEMPSIGGTYLGQDPIGLFWSMQVIGSETPADEQGLFPTNLAAVTTIRLRANAPGKRVAATTLIWRSPRRRAA